MRAIAFVLIATGLIANAAAQTATGAFTGRFLGSGRACYGTLAVQTKTISWLTTFSQCKSVSYELVEQNKQGTELRLTYRLTRVPSSCRYAILSLTHAGPSEDTGWGVTGYGSEQSYLADKASGYMIKTEDMMSCYVTQDPGHRTTAKR